MSGGQPPKSPGARGPSRSLGPTSGGGSAPGNSPHSRRVTMGPGGQPSAGASSPSAGADGAYFPQGSDAQRGGSFSSKTKAQKDEDLVARLLGDDDGPTQKPAADSAGRRKEMKEAMYRGAEMGHFILDKMPETLAMALREFDKNGDGIVDAGELMAHARHFRESRENKTEYSLGLFPEALHPALKAFDLDGDGAVSAEEMAAGAEMYTQARQTQKRLWRTVAMLLLIVLLLLAAILGLTVAAVELSKETTTEHTTGVMTVKGTLQPVSTARTATEVPLGAIPHLGMGFLQSLDAVVAQDLHSRKIYRLTVAEGILHPISADEGKGTVGKPLATLYTSRGLVMEVKDLTTVRVYTNLSADEFFPVCGPCARASALSVVLTVEQQERLDSYLAEAQTLIEAGQAPACGVPAGAVGAGGRRRKLHPLDVHPRMPHRMRRLGGAEGVDFCMTEEDVGPKVVRAVVQGKDILVHKNEKAQHTACSWRADGCKHTVMKMHHNETFKYDVPHSDGGCSGSGRRVLVGCMGQSFAALGSAGTMANLLMGQMGSPEDTDNLMEFTSITAQRGNSFADYIPPDTEDPVPTGVTDACVAPKPSNDACSEAFSAYGDQMFSKAGLNSVQPAFGKKSMEKWQQRRKARELAAADVTQPAAAGVTQGAEGPTKAKAKGRAGAEGRRAQPLLWTERKLKCHDVMGTHHMSVLIGDDVMTWEEWRQETYKWANNAQSGDPPEEGRVIFKTVEKVDGERHLGNNEDVVVKTIESDDLNHAHIDQCPQWWKTCQKSDGEACGGWVTGCREGLHCNPERIDGKFEPWECCGRIQDPNADSPKYIPPRNLYRYTINKCEMHRWGVQAQVYPPRTWKNQNCYHCAGWDYVRAENRGGYPLIDPLGREYKIPDVYKVRDQGAQGSRDFSEAFGHAALSRAETEFSFFLGDTGDGTIERGWTEKETEKDAEITEKWKGIKTPLAQWIPDTCRGAGNEKLDTTKWGPGPMKWGSHGFNPTPVGNLPEEGSGAQGWPFYREYQSYNSPPLYEAHGLDERKYMMKIKQMLRKQETCQNLEWPTEAINSDFFAHGKYNSKNERYEAVADKFLGHMYVNDTCSMRYCPLNDCGDGDGDGDGDGVGDGCKERPLQLPDDWDEGKYSWKGMMRPPWAWKTARFTDEYFVAVLPDSDWSCHGQEMRAWERGTKVELVYDPTKPADANIMLGTRSTYSWQRTERVWERKDPRCIPVIKDPNARLLPVSKLCMEATGFAKPAQDPCSGPCDGCRDGTMEPATCLGYSVDDGQPVSYLNKYLFGIGVPWPETTTFTDATVVPHNVRGNDIIPPQYVNPNCIKSPYRRWDTDSQEYFSDVPDGLGSGRYDAMGERQRMGGVDAVPQEKNDPGLGKVICKGVPDVECDVKKGCGVCCPSECADGEGCWPDPQCASSEQPPDDSTWIPSDPRIPSACWTCLRWVGIAVDGQGSTPPGSTPGSTPGAQPVPNSVGPELHYSGGAYERTVPRGRFTGAGEEGMLRWGGNGAADNLNESANEWKARLYAAAAPDPSCMPEYPAGGTEKHPVEEVAEALTKCVQQEADVSQYPTDAFFFWAKPGECIKGNSAFQQSPVPTSGEACICETGFKKPPGPGPGPPNSGCLREWCGFPADSPPLEEGVECCRGSTAYRKCATVYDEPVTGGGPAACPDDYRGVDMNGVTADQINAVKDHILSYRRADCQCPEGEQTWTKDIEDGEWSRKGVPVTGWRPAIKEAKRDWQDGERKERKNRIALCVVKGCSVEVATGGTSAPDAWSCRSCDSQIDIFRQAMIPEEKIPHAVLLDCGGDPEIDEIWTSKNADDWWGDTSVKIAQDADDGDFWGTLKNLDPSKMEDESIILVAPTGKTADVPGLFGLDTCSGCSDCVEDGSTTDPITHECCACVLNPITHKCALDPITSTPTCAVPHVPCKPMLDNDEPDNVKRCEDRHPDGVMMRYRPLDRWECDGEPCLQSSHTVESHTGSDKDFHDHFGMNDAIFIPECNAGADGEGEDGRRDPSNCKTDGQMEQKVRIGNGNGIYMLWWHGEHASSLTCNPTLSPIPDPTKSPTASPTISPTTSPTNAPTTSPTQSPTLEAWSNGGTLSLQELWRASLYGYPDQLYETSVKVKWASKFPSFDEPPNIEGWNHLSEATGYGWRKVWATGQNINDGDHLCIAKVDPQFGLGEDVRVIAGFVQKGGDDGAEGDNPIVAYFALDGSWWSDEAVDSPKHKKHNTIVENWAEADVHNVWEQPGTASAEFLCTSTPCPAVYVHKPWFDMMELVSQCMLKKMKTAHDSTPDWKNAECNADCQVNYFVGHSIGGAMATLFVQRYSRSATYGGLFDSGEVVTFGAPPTRYVGYIRKPPTPRSPCCIGHCPHKWQITEKIRSPWWLKGKDSKLWSMACAPGGWWNKGGFQDVELDADSEEMRESQSAKGRRYFLWNDPTAGEWTAGLTTPPASYPAGTAGQEVLGKWMHNVQQAQEFRSRSRKHQHHRHCWKNVFKEYKDHGVFFCDKHCNAFKMMAGLCDFADPPNKNCRPELNMFLERSKIWKNGKYECSNVPIEMADAAGVTDVDGNVVYGEGGQGDDIAYAEGVPDFLPDYEAHTWLAKASQDCTHPSDYSDINMYKKSAMRHAQPILHWNPDGVINVGNHWEYGKYILAWDAHIDHWEADQ